MAQTQRFALDDTSPAITYSPSFDTFSTPNLTAGWNQFYDNPGFASAAGDIGTGSSFHVTSHDQATLTIVFKGIGIDLLGQTQGNASYSVSLDNQVQQLNPSPGDNILASYGSLNDSTHTVILSAMIPTPSVSRVYFDGASFKFTTPSSDYTRRALDSRQVIFSKNWTDRKEFETTFTLSHDKGDIAKVNFTGVGFSLLGKTSPNAGSYLVTLDGVQTRHSARTTFTVSNATLFFATGLDATKVHNIQIENEDGSELSLLKSGFILYAPEPSPIPSATTARSKGTIAALVLAGLLGFFIICGSLFFMFVIRPRRLRRKQARRRRRMMRKVQLQDQPTFPPAPSVVIPSEVDMDSAQASAGHRIQRLSGLSGFVGWKRDVEANFESLGLGISFRHSGSTGKRMKTRPNREGESFSPMSSIMTFSSRLSSMRRKGKTKAKSKHVNESSSSPSFAVELSTRPASSSASLKEKEKDGLHIHPFADDYSITSELSSLSYMHTPSAPVAPPSYALSHSHSDSHSDAMHLISNSTPPLTDGKADVLLGRNTDPSPSSPKKTTTLETEPLDSLMSDPGRLSALAPRDRGSAQYSSDDGASYLGPADTRLAIRELSPRTSEFPDRPFLIPAKSAVPEKDKTPGATNFSNSAVKPDEDQKTVKAIPEDSDSSFLYIISPPNEPADMPISTPSQNTIKQVPNITPDPRAVMSQSQTHQITEEPSENRWEERSPGKKPMSHHFRSIFRMTLGNPKNSFIDFTSSSSSDASNHSQSGVSPQTKQHGSRPRWGSTTSQKTQQTQSGSSGISNSDFPYPVSLPPSPHHPEGHISSSANRSKLSRIDPRQVDRRPGVRLSTFVSPTESVPMSVTETELGRVSLSTDANYNPTSAYLPPHPPLPDIHKSNTTSAR